jgi:hypothetical protein
VRMLLEGCRENERSLYSGENETGKKCLCCSDPKFIFSKCSSKVRKSNGKFRRTLRQILTLNNTSQFQTTDK